MGDYTEIRIRELTDMGDWPWRYIVEGLTAERFVKKWPWSRERTRRIAPSWVRLRHGLRDYSAMQISDAHALARHYRATLSPKNTEKGALRPSASVPAGAAIQGEDNHHHGERS